MAADETVIRCAWLINPGAAPQANMRITVSNGRVAEIASVPADEVAMIEPMALLPRFVNPHTHLEFSALAQPVQPALPFTDWISGVVGYRRQQSDDAVAEAVVAGRQQSAAAGVDVVAEICTSDVGHAALASADAGGQVVSFRELLSFTRDRIQQQLTVAAQHLASALPASRPALSPHAPYSVHPELFAAAVDLAVGSDCCIAMHLAETPAELQLLDQQSGEFVDFLSRLNLWDSSVLQPGTSVLSYLQKLSQTPAALAVHGNYFGSTEINFLSRNPQVATVYCPRTHRYFGHPPHPWKQLRAVGATVLLGTDSRASNPDLSIWKELQWVAQQSSEPIWQLLPMITTAALRHLGFNASDGVIKTEAPFRAVRISCNASDEHTLDRQLTDPARQPVLSADH